MLASPKVFINTTGCDRKKGKMQQVLVLDDVSATVRGTSMGV
jgi:hypothetical protein